MRNDLGQKESVLMVANADGTEEKKLAVRKYPDRFSAGGPAWSPDGRIIACGIQNYSGGFYTGVIGVRVADGTTQPITSQRREGVVPMRAAWLSDNSGIFATGAAQVGSRSQLWSLSWPGDEALSLTSEMISYGDITLTADSKTLAAVRSNQSLNLWVVPGGDASRARQLTFGDEREDGTRGISWTPDGKIVYRTDADGRPNVWIMAADGSGNKQLSPNAPRNHDPAVSSDGRYVVWSSQRTRNVGNSDVVLLSGFR